MSKYKKCTCGRKHGDVKEMICIQRFYYIRDIKKGTKILSKYSLVQCTRPGCGGYRRSKGKYITELKDIQLDLFSEGER